MTRSKVWQAIAIAFGLAFATTSILQAAGGPPDGGGKPSVEVSNNLSYPILELNSGGASGTIGIATTSVTAGVFGTNFSYGCPDPDYPLVAEYPNRSCVSDTGVFWDRADSQCIKRCADQTIERMYWQKVPGQNWKSEVIGTREFETAQYVDWGDALESRTVTATSVARVETMPFSEETPLYMQGFEMWHVFGTGKTEMWGARVTDVAPLKHYMYTSPYAIIHTGSARLNLAKLSPGAVTCPTTPSEEGSSPYDGMGGAGETTPVWSETTKTWSDALFTADLPYSAELNIQGKYVYGYNWTLKTFNAGGYDKAGWWRLTFYADDVDFTGGTIIGPPLVPAAAPHLALLTMASRGDIEPAAETEGRLYVARVRGEPDHLTFIDVCISAARGGGGRKP